MQKPPPDREQIIADLLSVYNKHFHGYPQTKGKEQKAILSAVQALSAPCDVQELADDLEKQSYTIAAAGWPGAAFLMRNAARLLDWDLRHGKNFQSPEWPMSREEIAKELFRLARTQALDVPTYWQNVVSNAAKYLCEKPSEIDVEGKTPIELLQSAREQLHLAQIAAQNSASEKTYDYVQATALELQKVLRALQTDDAERSLVDG